MKTNLFLAVSFVLVAVLVLSTGVVFADSTEAPSERAYHQMAYDSESELVILYGGQTGAFSDPAQWNHETWSFDPGKNKWTQMSPNVIPGGSLGGSMTYNSKADRSILVVMSDDWSTLQTWAYDANSDTWTRLADGPFPMVGQRIVYDSESDCIIMFGGYEVTKFKYVSETWVYDYNTNSWENMKPKFHPSGRNYMGMVYDSKADRVVLWGDWQNKNYTPATDDAVWTYNYNTNTWQEYPHKKDGPIVRDYMMMAYDEKADKIVMYGGYGYGNDETWTYDLNTDAWQQMQPAENPGVISRYRMVYVKEENKTILFGGQDGALQFQYKNETWSYDLKHDKWTNVSPTP